MAILVGTSGWSYDHWQGIVYPHGAPLRDRLCHYVQRFQTVEVNSTYYRWPPERTFAGWRERVPEHFCMTVKAPRGLTHGARLYAPERWIERIGAGLCQLGPKRGVLLVQTPPDLAYDEARLRYFLECLPSHIQTAMEFRHLSWHQEQVFELLERHGVAYCVMSGAGLPCVLRATARFVYVRLHGPDEHWLYAGSYGEEALWWWAERIHEWAAQGRDVYAYFNNDGYGNAVHNAERLRQLVA